MLLVVEVEEEEESLECGGRECGGREVKEVSSVVSKGSGSTPERYTLTGFRLTACP